MPDDHGAIILERRRRFLAAALAAACWAGGGCEDEAERVNAERDRLQNEREATLGKAREERQRVVRELEHLGASDAGSGDLAAKRSRLEKRLRELDRQISPRPCLKPPAPTSQPKPAPSCAEGDPLCSSPVE